jgi:hypothetical protein
MRQVTTRGGDMARLEELKLKEAEWARVDKRKRSELEAFATRWCLAIAECGWYDYETETELEMKDVPLKELQYHISVIEMDIRLDREYDAAIEGAQ